MDQGAMQWPYNYTHLIPVSCTGSYQTDANMLLKGSSGNQLIVCMDGLSKVSSLHVKYSGTS